MDIYDTQVLTRVVEGLDRPRSHLLDTYFPFVQESTTELISFDTADGLPRITPFVSPLVAGRVVQDRGYTTNTFKPAYAKDKRVLSAKRAIRRAIGENIGGGDLTPAQRMDRVIRDTEADQLEMLTRREEVMASEALRLGTETVKGDGYETTVVNFGRSSANTVVLAGDDRWSQNHASSDPMGDLEAWSAICKGGGTIVTMHPGVWSAMRTRLIARGEDLPILGALRGGNSTLDMGPQNRASGQEATLIGTLGRFTLYTYESEYVDDDGVTQNVMPVGTLIMGSPLIEGTRCYGLIEDETSGFAARRYYVKSWMENDPPIRWILLQSAPLMVPYRPNASLSATVL